MTSALGAALAVSAAVVLGWGARTAVRPAGPVLDRRQYFAAYPALHGGFDPASSSVWVRGWLATAHAVARPLARAGVRPDVVTVAALLPATGVVVAAASGEAVPAFLLLVLTGLLDAVDGCLAVLTGRTTRWGYLLDSLVDRVTEVLLLWAAVLAGAPAELVVAAGAVGFLHEYARARAGAAGGDGVGRITAAERPVRLLLLAPVLLLGGAVPEVALAAPAVLLGVGLLALGQLLRALHRDLAA